MSTGAKTPGPGRKTKLIRKKVPANKRGRPTLLTPDLEAAICTYIAEDDMYPEVATCLAGASRASYYNWCAWGKEGKQPYADFLDSIKEAEAWCELNLNRAQKANPKFWAMYMTQKERRFPDRWGKRERVQQEHSGGLEIILKVSEANGNGNAPKK